jgi:hypothetical protein
LAVLFDATFLAALRKQQPRKCPSFDALVLHFSHHKTLGRMIEGLDRNRFSYNTTCHHVQSTPGLIEQKFLSDKQELFQKPQAVEI